MEGVVDLCSRDTHLITLTSTTPTSESNRHHRHNIQTTISMVTHLPPSQEEHKSNSVYDLKQNTQGLIKYHFSKEAFKTALRKYNSSNPSKETYHRHSKKNLCVEQGVNNSFSWSQPSTKPNGSFASSDEVYRIGRKISPRSSPPSHKGGRVRTPPSKIARKNGA